MLLINNNNKIETYKFRRYIFKTLDGEKKTTTIISSFALSLRNFFFLSFLAILVLCFVRYSWFFFLNMRLMDVYRTNNYFRNIKKVNIFKKLFFIW